MTNETQETIKLETPLERMVRGMEKDADYLSKFWSRNDVPFSVRADMKDGHYNHYAGYIMALNDVGLLDADEIKAAYTYLGVFKSKLTEAANEAVFM